MMADLRINGVYAQRQDGFFMQRVKLAAGTLSTEQALQIGAIAERFARGLLHLTTRCSIELHWLKEADLPEVGRMLAEAGLTGRGACGGAVRGVTCATHGLAAFPVAEAMAHTLHRRFTGNSLFEGLPKKFKISVEAGYQGGRHRIQDIGLVLVRHEEGRSWCDVWTAGGLGREPVAGFLLEAGAPQERLIPIIEAVIRVYASHAPAGKRLKHVVRELGQDGLRELVAAELAASEPSPVAAPPLGSIEINAEPKYQRLQAHISAGELSAAGLKALAEYGRRWADGLLMATADQNIAFHLSPASDPVVAAAALSETGFAGDSRENRVLFRVCPGSHECRMGLAPTRDIASAIIERMGPAAELLTWAISGCSNSCAQPQLAEAGVIVSRLAPDAQGGREPLFDFYRGGDEVPSEPAEKALTLDELLTLVDRLG